jgi:hypothetical protein
MREGVKVIARAMTLLARYFETSFSQGHRASQTPTGRISHASPSAQSGATGRPAGYRYYAAASMCVRQAPKARDYSPWCALELMADHTIV